MALFKKGEKKHTKSVKEVIKHKHRFVVMDSENYQEKFSFQLSGKNIFTIVGVSVILLVSITAILIIFTPLRQFIPGYIDEATIEQNYANSKRLDSLSKKINDQEWLIATMQGVMRGDIAMDNINISSFSSDKNPVDYHHSKDDSLLRANVESRLTSEEKEVSSSENVVVKDYPLIAPVRGELLSESRDTLGNIGIDIEASRWRPAVAVNNGIVIAAKDSSLLVIMHERNMISVYTNIGKTLRKEGQRVKKGTPVARLVHIPNHAKTTLHYQLWVNGEIVEPSQYMPL